MVLKYTHRLKAVFFDATHHLSIGKCNSNNNKNSEKKKRSRRQVPQSTSQPLTMTRHRIDLKLFRKNHNFRFKLKVFLPMRKILQYKKKMFVFSRFNGNSYIF